MDSDAWTWKEQLDLLLSPDWAVYQLKALAVKPEHIDWALGQVRELWGGPQCISS
jgi:hypothetical protein